MSIGESVYKDSQMVQLLKFNKLFYTAFYIAFYFLACCKEIFVYLAMLMKKNQEAIVISAKIIMVFHFLACRIAGVFGCVNDKQNCNFVQIIND